MEITTITISKKTKKDLDKEGNKSESYDDLIKRLIKVNRRYKR